MAMGLIAHLNRGRSCRGPGPLPDGEVLGRRFSKRLPPSKLLPTSSLRSTATNRTCPIKASGCILKDGSPIDISLTVSPMRNAAGKIVGASKVARDITERKRTDVQIAILAREAEHRAKNVLATVQATVQLSHSETPEGLKEAIAGRIQALANVHRLFVESRWAGAEIHSLITEELSASRPR